MAWEKSLFIGCTHGDLVCQKAVKVVKRFMDEWKPKHRVHLGDVWDFRALRRGASPEEKSDKIRDDYRMGLELLDWFKPQILTLGNHDDRPRRASTEFSNGPLADLMEGFVEDMHKDLRQRSIKAVEYGVNRWATLPMGGPKLLHGYRSTVNPAKAHFDVYGDCILAHVHKPDYYAARHADSGKAYTVGTLAVIEKMTYADSYTAKLGWRRSFLYGIHNTKTGAWHAWECVNHDGDWLTPHGVL